MLQISFTENGIEKYKSILLIKIWILWETTGKVCQVRYLNAVCVQRRDLEKE